LESGVAEGEAPGVGRGDPVALAAGGGGDAHRLEWEREELAPEGGVAEGRHLAGGRQHPVPPAGGGRFEPDGRGPELPGRGAEEGRVTEGNHHSFLRNG